MVDLFLREIHVARERITNLGGDPNAFEIALLMQPGVRSTTGPNVYTVEVVFEGKHILYLGGAGLDWLTDFECDLWWGVYGAIPGNTR